MEKDKPPFNDVIDHFDRTTGRPEKVELKKLPRPIRYIGYFVIGFNVVTGLLFIAAHFLD